ncbi:MAG: beta-lactamase family protein [Pirellulales bacterium]|nr:beta-lactamase family protein [Pirellulales bacterium]
MRNADRPDYRPAIASLERVVQEELRRGTIVGVSVALVDGQDTVFVEGFGLADPEGARPATAETIYRVGSISKLFTAVAAMQLVEQGKLDLDAPIEEYLPEFRIEVPFDGAGPITARTLMCHRSGMVREAPVGGYFDPNEPTVAQTVSSIASCALVNPPNTQTRYSNVGPTIVGLAVAAASGQSFEEYQREHVLGPLGMTRSAWRMNDRLRGDLAGARMRVADGRGGFTRRAAPRFELGTIPAGNLYATAGDLARFAQMILAEGRAAEGRRILRTETLREMATVQLIDGDAGFGLGFSIGAFEGHRSLRHNGAVYGFTSSLAILPEPGVAVVVLANEDIANGPVLRISNAALALMLEAKLGKPATEPPATVPLDADQLAALAGDYESPSYWAELRVVDGRLEANISSQPMTLRPIGPLQCEADGPYVCREKITFHKDDEGRVTGFTALEQTFTRIDPGQRRPIPAAWKKFLGSYGPDFIPLVVSERHGRLYAMTENMFDYRLTPVNQVVFHMPPGMYVDEFLVFEPDARGRIHAVNMANVTLRRIAGGPSASKRNNATELRESS